MNIKEINFKKYNPIILLALSAIVHFIFFGHPAQIVFDEVTFGKFIQATWAGHYYFDLHPPLGKLLLSLATLPFHMDLHFVFDRIGTEYTDQSYLGMRGLTTLCGTFLPLFIYQILNRIQPNLVMSFVAGLFIIFENNLLVVSRFFMLDIFILFFGFAAVLMYLKCKEQFTWKLWALTSILAACAVLTKWTGASFFGLIILLEFLEFFKGLNRVCFKKRILVFCSVGLFFYFFIFMIHFKILSHSGPGDDFMTASFQRDLKGSKFDNDSKLQTLNSLDKFIELNIMLWRYHQTMHQSHPYSSTAIDWLWMKRPIYYWEDGAKLDKARIYLIGNPFLWWAGSIAILFLVSNKMMEIFENIKDRYFRRQSQSNVKMPLKVISATDFLLILFSANYLPFFLIDRVMFIYHYNVALVVSLMALAYVTVEYSKNKYLLALTCLVAVGMFLFFAPLSYGLTLSQSAYQMRLWFSTWL